MTKKIKSYRNIHQHLDLIAGLPYEDYESFKKSFNDVYEIKPEKIQLGFLKLLKGSSLRMEEEKYGFKYIGVPPYEVLENNYIKYKEIIRLKAVEELVERYYNEGYFENSLEFIINNFYKSPFDFYEDFSLYWESNNYYEISISRTGLYEILLDFYKSKGFEYLNIFAELLRYDFIKNNKNAKMSEKLSSSSIRIEQNDIHNILKDERILENYLPLYKDLPTKRILNNVKIEAFEFNILELIKNGYDLKNSIDKIKEEKVYILFDYKDGVITRCNTYDITNIVKELI